MNAAHIHLMLNHIPVLGAVATLGLVALAGYKQENAITKLALQFMVLIAALTLPVYFTGEPAEEIVGHLPGVTESFIERHERYAILALGLTELLGIIGIAGLYRLEKNSDSVKKYWRSIQVIAVINAIVLFAVANLGGQIRHTEIQKAVIESSSESSP